MSTFLMWFVAIPTIAMAIKFWTRVGKFLLKNKRDLATRVQRARSVFAEGMQEAG
jgi:hypothetical protein